MKLRVIGVPSAWGTMELGARRTPDVLRRSGILDWLQAAGLQVEDGGDVEVPRQRDDDLWSASAAAPGELVHLHQVVAVAGAVRDAVDSALGDGARVLLVGGECCLSIGAVAALAARQGEVSVAWFDAHGDINTPATSTSGLITGMPFAVVLGHGHADLVAIGREAPRPAAAATFLIGGRDLDAGEVDNIRRWGVAHLHTEQTRARGPEEVALRILGPPATAIMPPEARASITAASTTTGGATKAAGATPVEAGHATPARTGGAPPSMAGSAALFDAEQAPQAPPLYLHFDVDSIDPTAAPGVHYRVGNGFAPSEVAELAGYLCASGRVQVLSVASANLDHDSQDRTIGAIRGVLTSIADALGAVDSAA